MTQSKQKQVQDSNKSQQEYDKMFETIKAITSRTKQAYVPMLCNLIKKGWPEFTNQEIQDKVLSDCQDKLGWTYDTIYTYIPSEFRPNQARVKANVRRKILLAEKENAPKVEQALKYFDKITEIPIKELPVTTKADQEEFEISEEMDAKLNEMGMGRFGGEGKTIHGVLGEINAGLAKAFLCLTEKKYMPTPDDDLENDYVKPSREFRRTLAFELDERRRTTLHNWCHYVSVVVEDMIEQINLADKK